MLITGPDAGRFMNFATVKDLSRQQIGQVMYTPMVNEDGKVAIEGLTLRLDENKYMFTQSGGQSWLPQLHRHTNFNVTFDDVTADYTCFALQGPRSTDILEALTRESFKDLRFSRWRMARILDEDVMVSRQGVTGEVGYEFLMRTDTGKAHELWRAIRRVGHGFRPARARAQGANGRAYRDRDRHRDPRFSPGADAPETTFASSRGSG